MGHLRKWDVGLLDGERSGLDQQGFEVGVKFILLLGSLSLWKKFSVGVCPQIITIMQFTFASSQVANVC